MQGKMEESWGWNFGAGLEDIFICGQMKSGLGYYRFLEDFDFLIKERQKIDNENRERTLPVFAVLEEGRPHKSASKNTRDNPSLKICQPQSQRTTCPHFDPSLPIPFPLLPSFPSRFILTFVSDFG